jgi:SRSO17 transposase
MQAHRKNMERMEEAVVGANEQSLQHMLTESNWDHQAVLDQVALDADRALGGDEDSCMLIDESGFAKKGAHSVGVARQWNGRLGKIDNCQVGVFSALGQGHSVALTDARLYLPKRWADDESRCKAAGIPTEYQVCQSKVTLALEMVRHQREIGVRFAWVGADGGYGKEPAFLRGLEAMGETFVVDVHRDQRIYLEDPQPTPMSLATPGRVSKRLQANSKCVRVDEWIAEQPEAAWQRVEVRDSTKGSLGYEVLHRRVWLWDGQESSARHWHLIVRREPQSDEKLKFTLSNAPAETTVQRLAFCQAQRLSSA